MDQSNAGKRIKIVETNENRLVLSFPAGGGGANFFGCIALGWNTIIWVLTISVMRVGINGHPMTIFDALFMGPLVMIGIGMAFIWFYLGFVQVDLRLDRDRIVLHRNWLGRKSIEEMELSPESCARHAGGKTGNPEKNWIEIRGKSLTISFGTGLWMYERCWLVDRINDFLRTAKP